MRFRRSIKLAPGLRMNLSGSGLSWTVGPRGASVSFGKRGTFLNTGIPGTGLSSRTALTAPQPRLASRGVHMSTVAAVVSVSDDGVVSFKDANGNPLSDYLIGRAKAQKGDAIRDMLADASERINETVESLSQIHWHTPSPTSVPSYNVRTFKEPLPPAAVMKPRGLLGMLFKRVRERIERENARRGADYEAAVAERQKRKVEHEQRELERKRFIEECILHDVPAMEAWLEENLSAIEWPRETIVSFEIADDGERISIDVDLPEVEDMPTRTASVPARGYKLSLKKVSTSQVQQLYMRHIHAVGFRIVGEAFADLPKLQKVTLSAYSQRSDAATATLNDEYLYSAHVMREQWCRINFENLQGVDAVEAFSRFDLRREMTKTGKFTAIRPLSESQECARP
jgi:hypothetical protein